MQKPAGASSGNPDDDLFVAFVQHMCLSGVSFDRAPKLNAESQGIMSSDRRFEMCLLDKKWRWDDGPPPNSEWSALREPQNERVRLGMTHVYMGKHKYFSVVHDLESGLMIYQCSMMRRIMIRETLPKRQAGRPSGQECLEKLEKQGQEGHSGGEAEAGGRGQKGSPSARGRQGPKWFAVWGIASSIRPKKGRSRTTTPTSRSLGLP